MKPLACERSVFTKTPWVLGILILSLPIFAIHAQDPKAAEEAKAGEETKASDQGAACRMSVASLVNPLSSNKNIPTIYGLEKPIEQIGDSLIMGKNVAITGAEKAGKTSAVYGLQQAISSGHVDPRLKNVEIVTFDWQPIAFSSDFDTAENALSGVRKTATNEQQVESRLKELKGQGKKLVLYVPELDILLGADSASASADSSLSGALAATPRQRTLANWLKRMIQNGEVQVIGELTQTKNMNKLGTIQGQFNEHRIQAMSESEEFAALTAARTQLQIKYGVEIDDQTLFTAQSLGRRYFSSQGIPVSSIGLLEEAALQASKATVDRVAAIDLLSRQIDRIKGNLKILSEESMKTKAAQEMKADLDRLNKQYDELMALYNKEAPLMRKISDLKSELNSKRSTLANGVGLSAVDRARIERGEIPALEKQIKEAEAELRKGQDGKTKVFHLSVDSQLVVQAASNRLNFPITFIDGDAQTLLNAFDAHLRSKVFGQDEVIDAVVQTIAQDLMGLPRKTPNKPRGVFMLAGPTGTGKDELGRAVNSFFAPGTTYIPFPMNEIGSKHELARLKGAPPGYVGHTAEGGQIAQQAKSNPFGVIGFAEFEKMVGGIASPEFKSAANEFMQIIEEGVIDDGAGNKVSLRNNILFFTLNLGDNYGEILRLLGNTQANMELIGKLKEGESLFKNIDPATGRLTPEAMKVMHLLAQKVFGDPFMARLDGGEVKIFQPLSPEAVGKIVTRETKAVLDSEFFQRWGLKVELTDAAKKHMEENAYDVSRGARGARSFVQDALIQPVLQSMMKGQLKAGQTARYDFDGQKMTVSFTNP